MRVYHIHHTGTGTDAARAEKLIIDQFRPESSDHRPHVEVGLAYDSTGLYVNYQVQDRYVRCVRTEPHSPVCRDSCVEFFVRPKPGLGYFNFETNCGGALLAYYITDWRRLGPERDLAQATPLCPEDMSQIRVKSSLPRIVEPEVAEPTTWTLDLFVPFAVLANSIGPLGELPGQCWRANFYKCGDETSHPHWATWNPVSELNFHLPDDFGEIRFV